MSTNTICSQRILFPACAPILSRYDTMPYILVLLHPISIISGAQNNISGNFFQINLTFCQKMSPQSYIFTEPHKNGIHYSRQTIRKGIQKWPVNPCNQTFLLIYNPLSLPTENQPFRKQCISTWTTSKYTSTEPNHKSPE